MSEPIKINSIEEITVIGREIFCWDGCWWSVDYVDVCPESGNYFMANGTEVTRWMPCPDMSQRTLTTE